MTFDPEKRRALDIAIAAIRRQFGDESILRMGDAPRKDIEVISTRCLAIDIATGVGGIPRGRITEFYGENSGGKTTLALHVVAEAQSRGLVAAYVDAEHSVSSDWAIKLGVDLDELFLSQPSCGEEGLEITEALIRSGSTDLIIIDSVAALVPRAELDGEMGDSLPGLHGRLMSQALRKITGVIHRSNTCVIFINQLRDRLAIDAPRFGDKSTTTGGRALKFYASMRIDIKRIGSIKQTVKGEDQIIGALTKIKIVKNKIATPFKEATFDLIYGEGISNVNTLLDLGVTHKIVEKSGAWYSFGGERLGNGKPNAADALKADEKLQKQISDAILQSVDMEIAERTAQKSGAVQ